MMRFLFVLPICLALSSAASLTPNPNSKCPTSVGRVALTKRFFESVFEQPERNHTSDALNFYDPEIQVVDLTDDYPSFSPGVPLPVRGLYAWNREMFLEEVEEHVPWPYYGVISAPVHISVTNVTGNIELPCWITGNIVVIGTLLEDYGYVSPPVSLSTTSCQPKFSGHTKGDPVEVTVSQRLELVDSTDYISRVNYTIDWSQWYDTLPSQ